MPNATWAASAALLLLILLGSNHDHSLLVKLAARLSLWTKHRLEMLRLRRRQLGEQISLRYAGLRDGIIIWETTVELGLKALLYLVCKCLVWLLNR